MLRFSRRRILQSVLGVLAFGELAHAQVPLQPFYLQIVRDRTLPNTLNLSDCITGTLYHGSAAQADPGTKLCRTLELPFRSNNNKISATAPGTFKGEVLTAGHLGWRIQLVGTNPRTAIQIHTGNRPQDTEGCVLIGLSLGGPQSLTTAPGCWINESIKARDQLRELYGAANTRPIGLIIH